MFDKCILDAESIFFLSRGVLRLKARASTVVADRSAPTTTSEKLLLHIFHRFIIKKQIVELEEKNPSHSTKPHTRTHSIVPIYTVNGFGDDHIFVQFICTCFAQRSKIVFKEIPKS